MFGEDALHSTELGELRSLQKEIAAWQNSVDDEPIDPHPSAIGSKYLLATAFWFGVNLLALAICSLLEAG